MTRSAGKIACAVLAIVLGLIAVQTLPEQGGGQRVDSIDADRSTEEDNAEEAVAFSGANNPPELRVVGAEPETTIDTRPSLSIETSVVADSVAESGEPTTGSAVTGSADGADVATDGESPVISGPVLRVPAASEASRTPTTGLVPPPSIPERPVDTQPTGSTPRPTPTVPGGSSVTNTSQQPTPNPPTSGTGSPSTPAPTSSSTAPSTNPPVTVAPTTNPPPSVPTGELSERLYTGWCRAGLLVSPGVAGSAVTRVAPGESIQSAIDNSPGGVVELAAGTHRISSPIKMRSGVILRGVSKQAVIQTSSAMDQMVSFGGGFTGGSVGTLSTASQFSRSITTTGANLSPGLWLIGGTSAGQLVRVQSVNGNVASLELPLTRDFSGFSIAPQKDPITRSGLERVKLEPKHTVRDLIVMRSAFDVWANDVETDGSGGQVRAAVYLRQAYRVAVYNGNFVTARELGDGGQGYGINIANNSSNVLIEGNRLERLRHSILLHAGASGNVVRNNQSYEPRHPNFVEGGPADISFHGYASGNLIMGNSVERIQLNDAGQPGPNNAVVGNTLRVGPLTLDNGISNLTLLGNDMQGSVAELRNRHMPSVAAVSTAGNPSPVRSYWSYGYDPFGRSGDTAYDRFGDGILDWGAGSDIYVDPGIRSINPCSL